MKVKPYPCGPSKPAVTPQAAGVVIQALVKSGPYRFLVDFHKMRVSKQSAYCVLVETQSRVCSGFFLSFDSCCTLRKSPNHA